LKISGGNIPEIFKFLWTKSIAFLSYFHDFYDTLLLGRIRIEWTRYRKKKEMTFVESCLVTSPKCGEDFSNKGKMDEAGYQRRTCRNKVMFIRYEI
jgi:hypothetical protein